MPEAEKTDAGSSPQNQESEKPDSQTAPDNDVKETSSAQEDVQKESDSSTEKSVAEAITAALEPDTKAPEDDKKDPETPEKVDSEASDKIKPEAAEPEEKPPTVEELYEEPEGLKPKGQERFRTLVEDNKATRTQLDEATKAIQEIQTTVQSSGMSPEQFGTMIEYGRLVHSKDPKDLKAAYDLAKSESRKLALELGIKDESVDLLSDFPDLKEQRESLEITEDAALEIARSRRRESAVKTQQEQEQQQQTQVDTLATEKNDSLALVKDFMASKKQTDIDYAHKETVLLSKVDDIRKNFEPKHWPKVIAQLYDTIGSGSAEARNTRKNNANQPITSSNSTTSGESHNSSLDAVKAALG